MVVVFGSYVVVFDTYVVAGHDEPVTGETHSYGPGHDQPIVT